MKKHLYNKINELQTANCPLPIAHWKLPIALCLLLIANCLLPIASFAQNTFRYEFSEKVGPYPYWGTSYSGTSGLSHTQQLASDSGYISYGDAAYYKYAIPPNNPPPDSLEWSCFSLIKLDKYANPQWVRAYQEKSNLTSKFVSDGTPTTDNNFIMVGQKNKKGNPYYNGTNTLIQKMDKDGHLLWAKVYPIGNDENKAIKVLPMADGGVVVMGQVKDPAQSDRVQNSLNTYLLRLDKDGGKIWCFVYDAKENGEETPYSLEKTTDGGFIIAGHTVVSNNRGMIIKTKIKGVKGYFIKVRADGTLEWARRYGARYLDTDLFAHGYLYDIKQTNEGSYIGVGRVEQGQGGLGWVVKTNAAGVIEWTKHYDTFSGIDHVEILSDGYMLASTDYESNNQLGSKHGVLTKINESGEVEWSKLYDSGISDISLALETGFVINQGTKNILKTNPAGEFDMGCVFNDDLPLWVDNGIDTLYPVSSTNPIFNPSDLTLTLKEITIQGALTCPVICGISDKVVAPTYMYAGTACVNTDAHVNINPWMGDQKAYYAHYKVNFGDPVSGIKNETTGSSMSSYEQVVHNYSAPGSYTITMVVYNKDYSQSDTVSAKINVVPKMKLTLLTPEIHVCKQDTLTISSKVENYLPGTFYSYLYEETYFSRNTFNKSVLSQSSLLNGNTLLQEAVIVADSSQKYYTISIYDPMRVGEECSVSDTFRVILGDNKAIITGDTKICKGETATLKASGGDSYLWSTGATTRSISVKLSSNKTFWMEAVSMDGCRDTAYVYVQVVTDVKVHAFAASTAGCVGDSVKIYATGTPNYRWSNGSTSDTIKVFLSNGINSYTVTGSSGSCTDTASVRISGDVVPNASIAGPANFCAGNTYILKASGGERYFWQGTKVDNPEYIFESKYGYGGTISVSVFIGGCSAWADIPYDNTASPGVEIACDGCRVCPGSTVTLKKTFSPLPYFTFDKNSAAFPENQNLTYHWSTGQTGAGANDSIKLVVTKDTIITLTTTNGSGCKTISQERIQIKPNFRFNKQVSSAASCGNSPTTLILSGEATYDFNYSWSNDSKNDTIVVSPLVDTMFYVTASANGCTHKDSIWVKAKSNLPKAWINGDSIVCKGASGTYTAKGGIAIESYKWLTGNVADTHASLTIPIAANSTLKTVVTFTGGCTDTAEYKISTVDVPHALISGDSLICPGGTASLYASGGITYQWSTLETTPDIAVTTNIDKALSLYAFAGNCSDTTTVTVKTNKTIKATLLCDEDTTCIGTPLTLIAGGGDHYSWNTGDGKDVLGILPAITTTYTVSITTNDNCNDVKSITITVKPIPTAAITGSSIVCKGDNLNLMATGGDTYVWSTGVQTPSFTINNPLIDNNYWVAVSVGSCSDTAKTSVSIVSKPIVDAGSDVSINYGNSIPLFATGTGTYQWSPEAGLSCTDCASPLAEPSTNTLYYIILKDANGCKNTDSVMVFVDLPCGDVFVPSAFSPNDDGMNDILFVMGRCIQSMNFTVYDRWGNKVFESTSPTKGWDGTYNEKPMNTDLFVYSLTGTLTNGETLSKKGTIMLMR